MSIDELDLLRKKTTFIEVDEKKIEYALLHYIEQPLDPTQEIRNSSDTVYLRYDEIETVIRIKYLHDEGETDVLSITSDAEITPFRKKVLSRIIRHKF